VNKSKADSFLQLSTQLGRSGILNILECSRDANQQLEFGAKGLPPSLANAASDPHSSFGTGMMSELSSRLRSIATVWQPRYLDKP
jgi:hypothetical protein